MADYKYGYYYGRPSNNEERSKTSHASSDHECRPVLVDAEGRRRPIIVLPGNTETYVTRTETYIEEVYSSSDDEPVKYYGRRHDQGNRHSSPTRDYPAEVNKFIAKIQNEASPPIIYPRSPTYRRRSARSTAQDDSDDDFGGHCDYNKKTACKPSGSYAKRHDKRHDGDCCSDGDSDEEPHLITNCGWNNASHANRSAPQACAAIHKPTNGVGATKPKAKGTGDWSIRPSHAGRDARLSAPINDIEKAIEYLKDAVNLQSGKAARNAAPATDSPKRGGYTETETIDSREAARRYGTFRPPQPAQETYRKTIDSREAARKYNGTRV